MPSRSKPHIGLPYAHGLFCEDVREEVGGTATYVGVLSGGIIAEGGLPSALPKLAIVLWVAVSPTDPSLPISFEIALPGGAIIKPGEERFPEGSHLVDPDATKLVAQIVLKLNNVILAEAGRIRVTVTLRGHRHVACSLRVVGPTDPAKVGTDSSDATQTPAMPTGVV